MVPGDCLGYVELGHVGEDVQMVLVDLLVVAFTIIVVGQTKK